MELLLTAVDVAGPLRWRWLLTSEETGEPLAEYRVRLEEQASNELATFKDLYGYARWRSAPDRQVEDGAWIVAEAGAWAGRELLGERVGAAIAAAAPATVRVIVPAPADEVMLWPLELAHVKGRPLAARGDVSLVYDLGRPAITLADRGVPGALHKAESVAALRILAVFSQPGRTSVLALRRERYALTRLIRRITARESAVVELRVVQYGVTRERLAAIAGDGSGWDVLHLSGHGGSGMFLLEGSDGAPDLVDTASLVRMLRPARPRVKLAVVSACESAADITAETLRLAGLPDQAQALEELRQGSGDRSRTEAPGLARALVRELDCAVLAMRYPVTDDFAIAFSDLLYEHLLIRGHSVDVAAARALAQAAGPMVSASRPAVSLATPGVFGSHAIGLMLDVPRGQPRLDPAAQKMAYFPDERERFVGRTAAMATASAALAPDSGRKAALLHGMAGVGKTACALELAHRHQDAFAAAAFWQAPAHDDEWDGALASLAVALEIQLGDYGFRLVGHIGTMEAIEAFLPRLGQVVQNHSLLLVLDNLETLLTPDGEWRDPRWRLLIAALCALDGRSRLLMTSRIAPTGLGPRVVTLPVHALSLDEAVTLARELPNLRGLLHADGGPVRAEAGADRETGKGTSADRDRFRRVLRVVQGHPKLLELADAAAADRDRLDAHLAAAERAADGQQLEAFFCDGTAALDASQFLNVLSTWTATALAALTSAERLMAGFLACLEENDRRPSVIDATWVGVWRRLNRRRWPRWPRWLSQLRRPPAQAPLLAALAAAALAQPDRYSGAGTASSAGNQQETLSYRMHPGVAAAIQSTVGPAVRDAIDTELATFWVKEGYRKQRSGDDQDVDAVVKAALAIQPYLIRLRLWDGARNMIEQAVTRDQSAATTESALPFLRQIADASPGAREHAILGRTLRTVDPPAAEQLLRGSLAHAVRQRDYEFATAVITDLVHLLCDSARLAEALALLETKPGYTQQAGLGPWSQLGDQALRLYVLGLRGAHPLVLSEVADRIAEMERLPYRANRENVDQWTVREMIFDTGYFSALAIDAWQLALDLNAELLASQRQRGASPLELASTQLNDVGPLSQLGRVDEARQVLRSCRTIFEENNDIAELARVFGVLAHLEVTGGHPEIAAEFERTVLRILYTRSDPREIAMSHESLARYLQLAAADPAGQAAHQLAAVLLYRLADLTTDLVNAEHVLVTRLHESRLRGIDGTVQFPATLSELTQTAELTDGVRLMGLIDTLEPDPQAAAATFAEILRCVTHPAPEDAVIAENVRRWEPHISGIIAACQPGHQPAAQPLPDLDELADRLGWLKLVPVLRRILAGERGETLMAALDPVDAAIARETLSRIAAAENSSSAVTRSTQPSCGGARQNLRTERKRGESAGYVPDNGS
jgi:hypothetical protein